MQSVEATSEATESATPRWVHHVARAAAIATFPLIVLGGLVTSYDVGMAVPDAPTTFGRNMLLYPIDEWLQASFGVQLEHGHRLFAAAVGLLTLVLAGALWSGRPGRWLPWLGGLMLASAFARGSLGPAGLLAIGGGTIAAAAIGWYSRVHHWRRWIGLVALGVVLAQGGFGALRVVWNERAVAAVHGVVAQLFFVLIGAIVLVTSRAWSGDRPADLAADTGRLRRLSLLTAGFVLLQLVLGAGLRHLGGNVLLVAHLAGAALVLIHTALLARRVLARPEPLEPLARPAELLAGLVVIQLMLGVAAWGTSAIIGPAAIEPPTSKQILFTTAHTAVGALVLAACVWLVLQSFRFMAAVPLGTSPRRPEDRRRDSTRSLRPSVSGLESRELWMRGTTAGVDPEPSVVEVPA